MRISVPGERPPWACGSVCTQHRLGRISHHSLSRTQAFSPPPTAFWFSEKDEMPKQASRNWEPENLLALPCSALNPKTVERVADPCGLCAPRI